MTRYKINIEYDGTDLIGWQENAQGPSVQSLLQEAIFQFCGEQVEVFSAGRTDAGVHAFAMVAHFDLEREQDA
ncbi:MAG: tRNA pseudouridine(38-40) synthase TruA, partial [Alphaproteobacteria bacterium]|nr:tRNA pseudouridine(38-40) synthase TruA [Alphaproteobacteria bacterium]